MSDSKRVLTVEDDFLVGEKLRGMLESEGHIIVGDTASGAEAVALTAELQPDVIFMDVKLLDMDGLEAVRRIMAQRPTPIIMLTTYDMSEIAVEASGAGVGYFLAKPATRHEIAQAIVIATTRFDDLMKLRRLNDQLQAKITEQERMEAALHERETHYQTLIDQAPVGIFRITSTGTVQDINTRMAEMLGYESKAAALHAYTDLAQQLYVDPDRRRDFIAELEEKGNIEDFEYETYTHRRARIWLRMNARISRRYPDGAFAIDGFAVDVTKRKRAENALQKQTRALQESQQRIEKILAASQTVIFEQDRDLRYTKIHNPHTSFTTKAENVLGKTDDGMLPPEDAARLTEIKRKALQSGDRQREDVQTTIDGKVYYYDLLVEPLVDDDGQVIGVTCAAKNITERKRAEQALRESEKRFRAIFEQAAAGIAIVLPNGKIINANEKLCDILGYTREELITLTIPDITLPEDLVREQQQSQEVSAGHRDDFNMEKRYVHKQGHIVWANLSSNAIRDEKGEIQFVIGVIVDITERKRAEQALREREQLFRTSFHNIKDGIFVHPILPDNEPGPFILVNDPACEMLGYSREELSKMTPWELDDPDSSDYIPQAIQQLQEEGNAVFEAIQVRKDGRKVLVEVNANVCALHGQPHIVSVVRDITKRKQAEDLTQARLRIATASTQKSSNKLMQLALDEIEAQTNSEIGFYHFVLPDRETIVLQSWSTNTIERRCQAEGNGRHYPISQAGVWADCIRERRPIIHNDYAALPHRQGMPPGHAPVIRELVFPIMRGDQVMGVLGVGNKPTDYTEEDVEIVAALGDFSWEIVERKRVEEALRESERRLGQMLQTLGEGMVRVNTEGKITYANPAAEEILEIHKDEILKRYYHERTWRQIDADGNPYPQERLPLAIALEKKQAVQGIEHGIEAPNGERKWLSVNAAPLIDEHGQLYGAIASFRDITEHKRAEAQLQEYAENLKRMVEEKVRELERERAKVIQAGKMAALGELATGVAHELSQPLMAIMFEGDYLKTLAKKIQAADPDEPPPVGADKLRETGENLIGDVERCQRITDHLREFGHLSENHHVPISLNQPIEDSFILTEKRLQQHNVIITHDLSPDLPIIHANPYQLEQVFLNLISNAEHAMEEMARRIEVGEAARPGYQKRLTISTYAEASHDGKYVVAEVQDNGCGVPAEVREVIFDPFLTTKPVGQGTGLGLSISRDIVEECGGEIAFTTEENVGTTFVVRFPIADITDITDNEGENP
ncbi:MAG: PAS domain S-box protein [Anaerolineales bacterium]